jgi:outer membrane protein TolC
MDRQPRVAAARASLAATEEGRRALEAMRLAAVLSHEIPIRRRQAALGVNAAAAGVEQAEREAAYAVTRAYYTVVYSRLQEAVARGVVERLGAIRDTAKRSVDEGARNVTSNDVNRTTVYLRLAEAKHTQAAQSARRALALLSESVGLGCDVLLNVADSDLPAPALHVTEEEIVALALSRRAELVRVNVFAQVTCLEADAQATSFHPRMATFAAGSDIHATQVPQEVRNSEYRPGAVPPEMPTLLVGSRCERIKRARELHGRALSVIEVTHNLITLEARDAFLRWEEAVQQIAKAREAATSGQQLAEDLTKDYTSFPGKAVRTEEVVNARVLAAQARSQYYEYLYRQVLALADLERATGGAFCAGLAPAVTTAEVQPSR